MTEKINYRTLTLQSAVVYYSFILLLLLMTGCKKSDDKPELSPLPPVHVISTSPENNQKDIPFSSDILVSLNTSFDTSKFNASLMLSQANTLTHGTMAIDSSTISFYPQTELLPLKSYTVSLTITFKNTGATLYNYKWNFTTKEPDQYKMTQRSTQVTDDYRDGNRVVQIGNYFYSFAGWKGNPIASYNDVYRSIGDLTTWERRPDAPWHSRHVYGLAQIADSTYVVGGDNLHPLFDVWRTTDGENWTLLADNLLNDRFLYGCTVHNSYIYVVGGSGYNDVWRSRNGVQWEQLTDSAEFLQGECFAGSLASFNGRLWMVCGGTDGYGNGYIRKEVWSSADGREWRREQDFAGSERYYTDVIVWDNKLWAIGGYNFTEGNIKSIWYMNRDGAWKEFETPAGYTGRHATALGIYNNQLVIACGGDNNDSWVIEKVK